LRRYNEEGIARFATIKYVAPDATNLAARAYTLPLFSST
jgi:hypothetical protein